MWLLPVKIRVLLNMLIICSLTVSASYVFFLSLWIRFQEINKRLEKLEK